MTKDEIIKLAESYNTRCLSDGRLWYEFNEDELLDFADDIRALNESRTAWDNARDQRSAAIRGDGDA